jgi:hypothetical protein
MATPIEQHAVLPEAPRAPEAPQPTVDKPQTRPTPIAYEEVVLTEEAATLLEELHQAAITAPKKTVRRVASNESPTAKVKNDRE